jgi:hypothetical protein
LAIPAFAAQNKRRACFLDERHPETVVVGRFRGRRFTPF